MKKMCLNEFTTLLVGLHEEYENTLQNIVYFISFTDFLTNIANISIKNSYCKPCINQQDSSYLDAVNLRHPIIEKIHDQVQYVANDVKLGTDNLNGMLLYGVNAVGKSSLMKSIGISIIMAQCGFYVAASKFTYSPYNYLFTRISNNDNIFKGQSSFAVEMSELRVILKRANNKSLILGDELCSGTETVSAISIVAAGILTLSNINSSFIFATHLHKLSNLEEINDCKNIKHFHMKTVFDPKTKTLIYNRKLQDGSGDSIYGLEVAKGMDLDPEFINTANNIRKKLMKIDNYGIDRKTSNYNSKIIIDKCSICKKKTNEIHHINEQNLANKNQIIDNFHKNSLFNLVQLCHDCHYKVHHGDIEIVGYKDTSDGIKLDYIINEDKINTLRRKYNNEQIAIIKDIYSKTNKFSLTQKKLKIEHEYNISIETLKKIINNNYF